MIKASVPTKIKARKAYISYVRSYARFKEKDIFHPKKLNLQRLVHYTVKVYLNEVGKKFRLGDFTGGKA